MDDANYLAAKWGVPVSIALLAVALRMLFSADRWTLIGMVRGLMVGALIGWLAILYVWDLPDTNIGIKGAMVGLAATLAEDIFVGILKIGKKLRDDPAAVIDMVVNWRRKP